MGWSILKFGTLVFAVYNPVYLHVESFNVNKSVTQLRAIRLITCLFVSMEDFTFSSVGKLGFVKK